MGPADPLMSRLGCGERACLLSRAERVATARFRLAGPEAYTHHCSPGRGIGYGFSGRTAPENGAPLCRGPERRKPGGDAGPKVELFCSSSCGARVTRHSRRAIRARCSVGGTHILLASRVLSESVDGPAMAPEWGDAANSAKGPVACEKSYLYSYIWFKSGCN